jgi:hypothetical protein
VETLKETGSGGAKWRLLLRTVGQSGCAVGISEHTQGGSGNWTFLAT